MEHLVAVLPQEGDPVLVRNLGFSGQYHRGRIASYVAITRDAAGRPAWEGEPMTATYRVVFLGRTATIRLRPAWERRWYRFPIYIEVTPEPQEGDKVLRRIGDHRDWQVCLMLFSTDAEQAETFDKYHYVVADRPNQKHNLPRMWIRWCYSACAFVPVQDATRIRELNSTLPR